jgi:hypothetical protein
MTLIGVTKMKLKRIATINGTSARKGTHPFEPRRVQILHSQSFSSVFKMTSAFTTAGFGHLFSFPLRTTCLSYLPCPAHQRPPQTPEHLHSYGRSTSVLLRMPLRSKNPMALTFLRHFSYPLTSNRKWNKIPSTKISSCTIPRPHRSLRTSLFIIHSQRLMRMSLALLPTAPQTSREAPRAARRALESHLQTHVVVKIRLFS